MEAPKPPVPEASPEPGIVRPDNPMAAATRPATLSPDASKAVIADHKQYFPFYSGY